MVIPDGMVYWGEPATLLPPVRFAPTARCPPAAAAVPHATRHTATMTELYKPKTEITPAPAALRMPGGCALHAYMPGGLLLLRCCCCCC